MLQTKRSWLECHDRKIVRTSPNYLGRKKTNRRKRRGSVTPLRYLPPGAIIIAEPQDRTSVGESGRSTYQQPRPSKLSPDQIGVIQRSSNRTLRELAAEHGVSHETIRAALKTRCSTGSESSTVDSDVRIPPSAGGQSRDRQS